MDKDKLNIPDKALDGYYEFVKLRYLQESERPNSLRTRVSIYITATALIFGVLSLFYNNFPNGESLLHFVFYTFVITILIFLGIIIYNFICFFSSINYGYPPNLLEIKKHIDVLNLYFSDNIKEFENINENHEELTNKAFKVYLADMLAECVEIDYQANNVKTSILVVIGRSISALLIFLLLDLVIYFFIK